MDTLLQDLRFAARSLSKHWSSTLIAVLCLALGIGGNSAIFSVVRAVLLASLPYRDPDQLVRVFESSTTQGKHDVGSVSTPTFLDVRAQNRAFQDVAAYGTESRDLGDVAEPERVAGVRVTPNLFRLLGAEPLIGRAFSDADGQPGSPPVVVLSERLWRRRFGADGTVIGTAVRLGADVFTVVGVMPEHFDFPVAAVHSDYWIPLVFSEHDPQGRTSHWLGVVGRLKPGTDSASAAADIDVIAGRLTEEYPDAFKDRAFQIRTVSGVVTGRVKPALFVILGITVIVLVIASANVASLMLARGTARRGEIALRTALGAPRRRIVRQFLAEGVLLAGGGGVLGLVFASWSLSTLVTEAASVLPRADAVSLNGAVLGFTAAVSLATGILSSLLPALRFTDVDVREELAEATGRSGAGRRHQRTLGTLIGAEIALSVVLLVGAGLLVRGFTLLVEIDPGFKPEHVATFHSSAPFTVPDTERYFRFYGPVLERLRALPGVRAAAVTNMLPLQSSGMNGVFGIVGRPLEADPARQPFAEFRVVSSGYFRALGIPVLRGREFDDHDDASNAHTLIVNDEFVRRYFPGEDPIGKQVLVWEGSRPSTIVGVVRSVRQVSIEEPPRSELYVNAAQRTGYLYGLTFVVSATDGEGAILSAARRIVHEIAPQQPVYQVFSMDQVVKNSLQFRRLTLGLLAVFAALAVSLAAAGVYGVMSYVVTQRRREIGVRVALGAQTQTIVGLILAKSIRLAGVGIAVGLAAAALLTRLIQGLLYGVGPHDPVTFAGVGLFAAVISLAASLVPALRASRVDPMVAMRAS